MSRLRSAVIDAICCCSKQTKKKDDSPAASSAAQATSGVTSALSPAAIHLAAATAPTSSDRHPPGGSDCSDVIRHTSAVRAPIVFVALRETKRDAETLLFVQQFGGLALWVAGT